MTKFTELILKKLDLAANKDMNGLVTSHVTQG